jgi:hypothetical protein
VIVQTILRKSTSLSLCHNTTTQSITSSNIIHIVCISPDVSYQELGRSIFLEGIFGLTHIIHTHCVVTLSRPPVVFNFGRRAVWSNPNKSKNV